MNEKNVQAYPLYWPDGWKRTPAAQREYGRFNKHEKTYIPSAQPGGQGFSSRHVRDLTITDGVQRVLSELQRMSCDRDDVIISTNVPTRLDGLPKSNSGMPLDPGAAVYWRLPNKPMRCMAVDRYTKVADNLAAIAATLDAMRAIERHGGAEILDRTFRGFAALPEHASSPWRSILEIEEAGPVSKGDVDAAFRRLVQKHHPDIGGDENKFKEIVRAREAAYLEVSA